MEKQLENETATALFWECTQAMKCQVNSILHWHQDIYAPISVFTVAQLEKQVYTSIYTYVGITWLGTFRIKATRCEYRQTWKVGFGVVLEV